MSIDPNAGAWLCTAAAGALTWGALDLLERVPIIGERLQDLTITKIGVAGLLACAVLGLFKVCGLNYIPGSTPWEQALYVLGGSQIANGIQHAEAKRQIAAVRKADTISRF